jgi:hypothetical protein
VTGVHCHGGATLATLAVDAHNAELRGDGGFSQALFMRDVENWGVMTIGTGLGNARFINQQ